MGRMIFTAVAGCRYQAIIKLGWGESLVASNDMIKGKLEAAGLKDVVVSGSGRTRTAEGTATQTATVDLPSQIDSVTKI